MQLVSRKPAEAEPARMAALAKLPVFLDLAGRRAVIAGGSAAAAWKAELIAAAGADVEVYARELAPEMAALIARGAAAGTIVHRERPWSVDIFGAAAIAIADADSAEDARAFYCAARAAGVPVNVIDKPAYCQFQIGSIVNRSPVVVAISTDGASPVLGQAIRRRIEMLLPAALADWGRLARTLRATVARELAPGPLRRAFWERFAERAFGPPPGGNDGISMRELISEIGRDGASQAGRVTLVGAGPGDAELLTIKAVRALQSADVILYDDLVSDDVLELARREAKRMMVGKRGRRDSCRQEDINSLMVGLARQGRHVVRLKCGDPMIFGRAGEEIAELEAAGVNVTVVPGVTSALAMAASLGVSLTHRDHAHSVRFVTGHARSGELADDLDWRGLADPKTTLVVYMGGRTIAKLAARLIAEGLTAATPLVVVAGVATPDEMRIGSTVGDIERDGLHLASCQPVLIGIGTIFGTVAGERQVFETLTITEIVPARQLARRRTAASPSILFSGRSPGLA